VLLRLPSASKLIGLLSAGEAMTTLFKIKLAIRLQDAQKGTAKVWMEGAQQCLSIGDGE
jgi:hypothetical protein